MTHKATVRPTAGQMLIEAQDYRTSLEALMSVGRAMLLTPSLEDDSASSFKVLAENVLEQADHQGDLQVVDGVEEPQAQVELIMQDVLTPRLTEIEAIEQSLQERADEEVPEPFTTRDVETASTESFKAEALGLFHENIQTIQTVCSMEGMTADAVRPLVLGLANRVGDGLSALNISLEELGQTQVLGEMSEAVDRIEALVQTAKTEAEESCQAAREEASELTGETSDKMGDLIERHREENPSGPKLDSDVKEGSVESDTPVTDTEEEGDIDPIEGEEEEEGMDDGNDLDLPDGDADIDSDLAAADEEVDLANAEAEAEEIDSEEEDDSVDSEVDEEEVEEEEIPDVPDVEEGEEADLDDESEEEDDKDDDAEEEEESDEDDDDETASTESHSEVQTIDAVKWHSDEIEQSIEIMSQLMSWLNDNDLLSDRGREAFESEINHEFRLESDMVLDNVADVLLRHYETWRNASIRDGEANVRALGVLLGI